MNAVDNAFILICAGLVFMMTPALALFYGGLVRSRNVLSTSMHSYACLAVGTVLWFFVGYSLAFGPDQGGLIGDFSFVLFEGVSGTTAPAASNLPHETFAMFAHTLSGHAALLGPVAHLLLRAHGPLGLGWRLDGQDGCH